MQRHTPGSTLHNNPIQIPAHEGLACMSISRLLAALLIVLDVAGGTRAVAAAPVPGRPTATRSTGTLPLTVYASVVDARVLPTTGLGGPWQGPLNLPSSAQPLAAASAAAGQDG